MSWMSRLYETYEKNIGKEGKGDTPLTPLAHMYANAQLQVTLDAEGNFAGAKPVDKKEAVTLIPVTEASAGRASGIAPHALSDTLSYLAGDFGDYCPDGKLKKIAGEKYICYMQQLQGWQESPYTHVKVDIIYRYLCKKTLMADLIQSGIVTLADHVLDDKKISGQPYEKAIVRFIVNEGTDDGIYGVGGKTDRAWKDTSLIKAYTSYYLSKQTGSTDLCYLSGKEGMRTENHPKGIVAANYGAKLVSANDNQGFTYRGRFQNANQAYALSYEASQKIHSALTWLVKKQGVFVGTKEKRTFLCWNPGGKKTPDILDPFAGLVDEEEDNAASFVLYKKKLIKTMMGYQEQFGKDDDIIVMALDAATTGRLSVTYYNEFAASDFLDRIQYWGETCSWQFLGFTQEKKAYYKIEAPLFEKIVKCAFGCEQGAFIDVNDKVLKEQVQRLTKCMLERQPMPRDVMDALVGKASNPLAYSRGNRERVLSTACAVIAKYRIDRGLTEKGEEMKLDIKNEDRSYLFGRLLAVLERVERITYERRENREPNAIRLQSVYKNHPMQTWMTLEEALRPYFQKLKPGSRDYYKNLISEIIKQFREEDQAVMNQGLKETYLLGYYLQRDELYAKNKEQKEETEE